VQKPLKKKKLNMIENDWGSNSAKQEALIFVLLSALNYRFINNRRLLTTMQAITNNQQAIR
jgi:hypothetical protein